MSRRIAELEEAANAAIAREVGGAVRDRDALSAAFDVERKQTAAAWADADARLTVIDGELAAAEQARLEAEERAEEAVADRDELGSRLAAAVKSVQGMNAAVDERLAAIDAKRARALQQAQERAEAATRERDALAAELAALASAPAAAADPDSAQQLEVALERIHALELQLSGRATAGLATRTLNWDRCFRRRRCHQSSAAVLPPSVTASSRSSACRSIAPRRSWSICR